jgi:hypothetical protein
VTDGAEPLGAPVAVLPAGLADPDLAGSAEGAPVHDPAELGSASAALSRRIDRSGPENPSSVSTLSDNLFRLFGLSS